MARIRTIKPEFWVSRQIVECSTNARLMFIGLWNFCDDQGVHPVDAKSLKMEVYPGDDFTVQQVQDWIDELLTVGLLTEVMVPADATGELQPLAGKRFWRVTGWHHQRIDRPFSRYPNLGSLDEHSTNTRRLFDDLAGARALERKGVEGKGKEGKGVDVAAPRPPKAAKQFQPPSLEEVTAYCLERANGIDPEAFIAHYGRQGWKLGNGRTMKDWRLAVVTWEKNERRAAKPQTETMDQFLEEMGHEPT